MPFNGPEPEMQNVLIAIGILLWLFRPIPEGHKANHFANLKIVILSNISAYIEDTQFLLVRNYI